MAGKSKKAVKEFKKALLESELSRTPPKSEPINLKMVEWKRWEFFWNPTFHGMNFAKKFGKFLKMLRKKGVAIFEADDSPDQQTALQQILAFYSNNKEEYNLICECKDNYVVMAYLDKFKNKVKV